jgi:hypothetical protein
LIFFGDKVGIEVPENLEHLSEVKIFVSAFETLQEGKTHAGTLGELLLSKPSIFSSFTDKVGDGPEFSFDFSV